MLSISYFHKSNPKMTSFMKNMKLNIMNSNESVVKSSIACQLSETIKQIQFCTLQFNKPDENISGDTVDINEASSTLCTVLEAAFLHGLKHSFAHRARTMITSSVDQKPQPNFWSPLLVFSHRQIVEQITALPQITTEIGQCRAWIRISLNDCLLSSYLASVRHNASALKPYYNSYAFLRDQELMEIAQLLIQSIETLTEFSLPCNSSLLNSWSMPTLLLAGIWSPPLRNHPVLSGVDVAQLLDSTPSVTSSETCSLNSVMSLTSQSSGLGQMLALNEEEALKIILNSNESTEKAKDEVVTPADESEVNTTSSSNESNTTDSHKDSIPVPSTSLGNSLNGKTGWSFDEERERVPEPVIDSSPTTPQEIAVEKTSDSYHALVENYSLFNGSYVKTPDLRDVWQQLEDKDVTLYDELQVAMRDGGKVKDDSPVDGKCKDSQSDETIGKLAVERGLDAQNYECADCGHPLGLNFCKLNICFFSGNYFCDNCMNTQPISIPARIVHNWDFKEHPVSKKAAALVDSVKTLPVIDFKILNPHIYIVINDMARLQTLRVQLNFLRAYLFTCRAPVIEQLKQLMVSREHMYEHIHKYSVLDLQEVHENTLAQKLEKVIAFGREHVLGCWLCSQKGFICEICKKPKVLYPFDTDHTYRCKTCGAVYHNACFNATRPCPKCKRRQQRQELSLLDAIH